MKRAEIDRGKTLFWNFGIHKEKLKSLQINGNGGGRVTKTKEEKPKTGREHRAHGARRTYGGRLVIWLVCQSLAGLGGAYCILE